MIFINIIENKSNKLIKSVVVLLFYTFFPILVFTIFSFFGLISNNNANLLYYIVNYSIIFLVLLYVYRETVISDIKEIIQNKKKYFIIIVKKTILVYFIVVAISGIVLLINNGTIALSDNEKELDNILKNSLIYYLLLSNLFLPFIEGIVFRKTLKDIFNNTGTIIFSSLLYMFINLATSSKIDINVIYSLLPSFFVMGILSKIYCKYNNLVLSIFIWMVYFMIANFVQILL